MKPLFDTAVHAQLAPAVTATVPVEAAAGIDADVGLIENVHDADTVIVPVIDG